MQVVQPLLHKVWWSLNAEASTISMAVCDTWEGSKWAELAIYVYVAAYPPKSTTYFLVRV